jgi:hypothetical protein
VNVRRITLTVVGCAAVLVALVTPAAGETLANRFTADIGPEFVQPLSTAGYVVQVTNRPQSDATANNAHVVVPGGFVVDPTSLTTTTSAAGSCSASTWTVALNTDTSTMDAVAPNVAGELCPGGTLTLTFGATAPSEEGTYTWTTTLFHDANGFGLQGSQLAVAVDGTPPPTPTLTGMPSDPSGDASPSFDFSDGDPTATFVCQLDGGAAAACSSTQAYSGLGEGTHTFNVTAVDPAGNQSSATSYGWTIDLTPPPAPTITSGPPGVTGSDNATFSFTDGDATAGFQCRLDGASSTACTSPISYGGLAEGAHTFRVSAVDAAANQSSVTTYSWTVDLTRPPAPTITSAPPAESDSSSATFSFTDADASATFQCRLDGGSFVACTSPQTYSGLAEGNHTFRIKAVDPAGNQSSVTTYSWTIDLTPPPAPTITSAPPAVSGSSSASFSFTDGDGSASFQCRLDGAAFSACTSPVSYGGLGEGAHTFRVKAVDPAGNESGLTSYSWTIDLTLPPAPAITSAPPGVTDATTATFAFTDGDASAIFRCRMDSESFAPCTSPITFEDLSEGTHTFGVKAVDPAGNESGLTTYTWTIDLTNPVVTIDPASKPPDPTNRTSASFVFTSNKAGSTFECRLDGSSFSPCSSPAPYTGLTDRRHSFGVRATDSLGHVGLASTYDWTVDTVRPVTTITSSPPPVSNSTSATFAFRSSETSPAIACSVDDGPFGTCASPKTYAGLVDGTHVFRVRSTDVAGNTEQPAAAYTWQIVTSVPPDLTPPGPISEVRRIVGYRLLKLSWAVPADPDVAYVRILRSRSPKAPAQKVVYQGKATSYADKRFQNGTYYRYEIQAYDTAGNASSLVQAVVPPSMLLRSPRNGQTVKAPPLLLWTGVPRAAYYNVQVYRGAQKVLSAWPSKPRLRMRSTWTYNGHRFRLRKGGYRWWVWPGFGPRSKAAYGQLLGTGTFIFR